MSSATRKAFAHSSKARLFCSNTNPTLSTRSQTLQTRIDSDLHQNSKISTVLEQWRQQGNKLNPSLVKGIFEKLRDSKQYPQALEVSTWMAEGNVCSLLPEDYTARFHLIENVLGFKEAEKFLEKVPENLRNEHMYTTLLKSYAKKKYLNRAEAVFNKMRELGLLLKPSPSMTSLYISVGIRGKVDEILREMEENNVELDSLEMAKAYLRVGSKREAREMLVKAEELNDPKELMRLYGEAGDNGDVYRMWNLYKKTRGEDNDGFLALFASLLNLDGINGAALMYYKEYEWSGLEFDVRIPTMLVSGFRKHGMVKQADVLMNKTLRNIRSGNKPITPLLEKCGKPSELRDLIKNLQDSNKFTKALEASSWFCDQKMINLFRKIMQIGLILLRKCWFFETSIPETMKGYSFCTTLLNMYTISHQDVGEAEAIFEKMGELAQPGFQHCLLQELNLRILGLNLLHKLINEWIVS
ncbi:LOW QUALITY PROTEIN: hypothetical protein HID58_053611 [Brassica napus]|uniref:Pentatricopeptide repeat-containing protein n=1 Tax=Brassica napus TaxID=3708 RepID=A0ABQ8AF65_BRANA|nr:LOW QUALITY PROTEIN: hypothetical protein HID58_053611 [Brassica napus]